MPKRLRYFLHQEPARIGPVLRIFLDAVEDRLKASSPGAPSTARFGARGRKKALSPEKVAELRRRASAGEQKANLAREFGISRETLYQYLRMED